ncbi:hypothetical protein L1787_00375 [Acuticoccus sp. M5D2P5]|uniref:hypothetical protein n=1 Tax=Acuticoccus kalidii TaxID=2910977 RepID=UPI001F1F4511|nr:hypothetical protein [Acuticoccus kalidii]MCF3931865.1 hypothetical protein [Acuticoccus kalidii]
MIKRAGLLLLLPLVLAGCDAPQLTGIAAGFEKNMSAPQRPLTDPATATFAFEPFPGIPGNVGDDLLRRIWLHAEREGIQVVKRPGGPARFHVQGTLTAVSNDTNSLVIYVFDIKDVTGRRLHRISGRQRSNDSQGDPWSSIESGDLDLIAVRLTALINAWLHADA